jgi:Xaa-Pro aminopeptidase
MTFAIETQQGEEDIGGARLEEMVVVTDTGYEVMTRWPSEEITVVQHSLVE